MRDLRPPLPVKLFIGMLAVDRELFSPCEAELSAAYGPVDMTSDVTPWSESDFYQREMGAPLYRKFIFFQDLIDPARLVSVKRFAYDMEKRLARADPHGMKRRINLDPGYVTEAKVILATVKDYAHRIYLGENIYAEVTLRYQADIAGFTHFDHTYYDYRRESCLALFNNARDMLRMALQKQPSGKV